MNISARSNPAPQQTIQEAARTSAIGQPNPTVKPTGDTQLKPQDQVSSNAPASGRAMTSALGETSPVTERLRSLIQAKDYDALAQVARQLGARGLGKLGLSVAELQSIAQGLGQGGWRENLPLMGSYTDEERQAVQLLIEASSLSIQERFDTLNTLVGPDAVYSYARSAPVSDIKKLSATQRQLLLSVLDSGNSIWGSVSGAAKEAVLRRAMGSSQREEHLLASKVLRAARNESELRDMFQTLNQFNRDDVAFRYVMELSPHELSQLSDGMKRELLTQLVDTGIQLPFMNVDLNSVGNLDETLSMTFKEHVDAAKRLYISMKPSTQQSGEVQALVQKSDALMAQVQEIEQRIQQDVQSGKITQDKIASYRQSLESIKSQHADKPEIQQKVQTLMHTLSKLQEQLGQANHTRQQSQTALAAAQQKLGDTQSALSGLKTQINRSQQQLNGAQQRLKTQEQHLISKHSQMTQLRRQMGEISQEYSQTLNQMESLLQNNQSARAKLPQLEQLSQRLKQLESQAKSQNSSVAELTSRLENLSNEINTARQDYNQAAESFNTARSELSTRNNRLGQLLESYQSQITALQSQHQSAQSQLVAMPAGSLSDSQKSQLQQDLSQATQDIQKHQTSLQELRHIQQQEIAPAVTQIDQAKASLAPQETAVSSQAETSGVVLSALTAAAGTLTGLANGSVSAIQSMISQVSDYVSSLKQRLGTLNLDQLRQERSNIEKMRSDLLASASSPEDMKATLSQLDSLLQEVTRLDSQLQETTGVQNELEQTLSSVQERQHNINRELNAASQAAERARDTMETARGQISSIEQNLGQLSQDVSRYQAQAQEWQVKLQSLEQSSESQKASILAKMAPPGSDQDDPGAALNALSRENRQARAAIEQQLARTQQQIKGIQGQIQSQQETLSHYRQQLQRESSKLNQAQEKMLDFQQQLGHLTQENNRALVRVESLLQQVGTQSGNQRVQDAINSLSQKHRTLKTLNQESERLIAEAVVQSDSVLKQERQIKETLGYLSQTSALSGQTEQALRQINQTALGLQDNFANASAHNDRVLAQMRQFVEDIETGRVNMSQAEILQQQRHLLGQFKSEHGEVSGDLGQLNQRISRLLGEASQLDSRADATLSDASQRLNAIGAEHDRIKGEVDQIQNNIGALEGDMARSEREILGNQRLLLEKRRQLGIESHTYHETLNQASRLLNLNRPLNPQEQAELAQLTQRLSHIEAAQASIAGPVSQQIASLNGLKAQINGHLDSLQQKGQQLAQLRQELQGKLQTVQILNQQIRTQLPQLIQGRDDIAAVLLNLKANPLGTKEYRDELADAESKLRQLDDVIARLGDKGNRADALMQAMGQTLSAIDQTIVKVAQLKQRLELIQGRIEEKLQEAQALLQDIQAAEQVDSDLKQRSTSSAQHIAPKANLQRAQTVLPSQAQPATSEPEQTQTRRDQRQNDIQRQSFSEKLTNGLSNLLTQQRRRVEERRESEIQERREDYLAVLDQQVSQARQMSEEAEQLAQRDVPLIAITDHLLSQP